MKKIVQLFFCSLVVSSLHAEPARLSRLRNFANGIAVTEIPYVGQGIKRLNDGIMNMTATVAPDNEIAQGVAKACVGSYMPVSVARLSLPHVVNGIIFEKDSGVASLFPTGKKVLKAFFNGPLFLGDLKKLRLDKNKVFFPLLKHGFAIAFLNGEISKDSLFNYASSMTNHLGAKKVNDFLFSRSDEGKEHWADFANAGVVSGLTAIAENKDASIKNRLWARFSLLGLQGVFLKSLYDKSYFIINFGTDQHSLEKCENAINIIFLGVALGKSAEDFYGLYKEYKEKQKSETVVAD